jgi:hypothetical protein
VLLVSTSITVSGQIISTYFLTEVRELSDED